MCVVSGHWWYFYVNPHTHRNTQKQILRWNSTYTEQGFNSFFIVSVHRTSSTVRDKEKKGGKHKPSGEEYVPFEVVFLLGASFGVTWLVKQIIKCNGLGGLQSFISDGKNKVLDDLGGFWSWIWWEFPCLLEQFTCANRQVLSSISTRGITHSALLTET